MESRPDRRRGLRKWYENGLNTEAVLASGAIEKLLSGHKLRKYCVRQSARKHVDFETWKKES